MVSTLLLVPTEFELQFLSLALIQKIKYAESEICICGFGPIVSAIRTTQLIAEHSPKQILLTGVAGAFDPRVTVGTVTEFDEVGCFGIGAGSGDSFLSAGEMGWSQWTSHPHILDSLPLQYGNSVTSGKLLTCCSASANEQDVQFRLTKHPNAIAEDMEGFSVAAACSFARTPLRIIRGISNRAGDRNKDNWRIRDAMLAVEVAIDEVIAS